MANFDSNQPRDEDGKWTAAGRAARKAAGLKPEYPEKLMHGQVDPWILWGVTYQGQVEAVDAEQYTHDLLAEEIGVLEARGTAFTIGGGSFKDRLWGVAVYLDTGNEKEIFWEKYSKIIEYMNLPKDFQVYYTEDAGYSYRKLKAGN